MNATKTTDDDPEMAAEGGETIPATVVERLVAGDSPIKVFRRWHSCKQKEFAATIGTSPACLSQL